MHTRTLLLVVVTVVVGACRGGPATARMAAPAYPPTRTVAVVDDYHGTKVADPYQWLEDLEASEVKAWAGAQRATAEPFLQDPALRPWLIGRTEAHAVAFDELVERSGSRVGQFEFRLAPAPGNRRPVLLVQPTTSGTPRVFVDPATFGPGASVERFEVSPDARFVSYAIAEGGSEWVQTRIRRVFDGRDEPEVLEGLLFEPPVWTRDGRGFFYVHQQRAAVGERTLLKAPAVLYHRVGTPQDRDQAIFRTPEGTTDLVLDVGVSPSGRYAIVSEGHGAHVEGLGWLLTRAYLLDLRDPYRPDLSGPLRPLTATRDAGYAVVAEHGGTLLMLTDRGAPRRRVVAVDPRDPGRQPWPDVIPESTAVLQTVSEIGGRLIATYLQDVQPVLRIFDRTGQLVREITQPPMSTIVSIEAGDSDPQLRVTTMQFFSGPRTTRYNVVTGASEVVHAPASAFAERDYEATQQWYTAKDGARVPMFVLNRKGLALDGSHPALLFGYGASGQVMSPGYAEDVLAWLELGGVYAVPSLRGGGEYGRAWYEAAILERKQTTIDDFIAAAEFLIAKGYTTPAKLAILGASNGGMLVAATLTERPDLFAAAIAEVPMTDLLRYDRGRHRAQFGSPQDASQFPFLFAYSPLHRVKPGTCYPATLITTSLNDVRAPAWHAMKFTAALQAVQACPRPIVLRADDTGGHSNNRGPDGFLENAADILVFAARAMGVTRN